MVQKYLEVEKIGSAKVIVDIVPTGNYEVRPQYSMIPEDISIHNTGNDGEGADARMHNEFIHMQARRTPEETRYASWHLAVDANFIYQHLPFDENGWATGDGSDDGSGNRVAIHIEICENRDGDYQKAERNAVALAKHLSKVFDISITKDHVRSHKSYSGKYCPRVILNRDGNLDNFRKRVREYGEKVEKSNDSAIGEIKSDVWLHDEPNFEADSRTKVLEAGDRYHVYGVRGDLYIVGASQFVSKKYVEIVEGRVKETEETGKGVIKSDVWGHDEPNFYKSSRTKVLEEGEKVTIYGSDGDLFKIGKDLYVSKKYVTVIKKPKAKTGVCNGDVYLHDEPNFTTGSRAGVLRKGTKVGVYGEKGALYRIRKDGKTLYVSKKYLDV